MIILFVPHLRSFKFDMGILLSNIKSLSQEYYIVFLGLTTDSDHL